MSDLLIILIIAVCLAYIIFIVFDTNDDSDIIYKRLYKISQSTKTSTTKETSNFIEFIITFYFEPLVEKFNKSSKKGKKNELKQLLMEAGKPFSDEDIMSFKAKQFFSTAVCTFIILILGIVFFNKNILLMFAFIVVGAILGMKLPVILLRTEIKKRCAEIAYNLPDALDLLVVCVEAGLGLDAALTRVSTEQMRTCPVIAKELGRVSKDVMAGIPRAEAFRNLGLRNNVPDLRSFVALLIQTDKLGTSIAQSLRVYADTVRTKRRQRAEKLAAEASIKMVIPLVLFILPSMFVVLLGPAIINLIQQFSSGGTGAN